MEDSGEERGGVKSFVKRDQNYIEKATKKGGGI